MNHRCIKCNCEDIELVDVLITGFAERNKNIQKLIMKAQYVCNNCDTEFTSEVTGTVDWGSESE